MKKFLYFFVVLIACVFCAPLVYDAPKVYADEELVAELTQENFVNTMTVNNIYSKFILKENIVIANNWDGMDLSDKEFDGNGFTITTFTPLFKNVTNSVIKNLGVIASDGFSYDKSSATNKNINFGLLAGTVSSNSLISCCYVSGQMVVRVASSAFIGGMIGSCDSSVIQDSYAKVKILVTQHNSEATNTVVGGMVGKLYSSRIVNSYAIFDDVTKVGTDLTNMLIIGLDENLSSANTNIVAGGLVAIAENGATGVITNVFVMGKISLEYTFESTEKIIGKMFGKLLNYSDIQCSNCYYYNEEETTWNLIAQKEQAFNLSNAKIIELTSNIFTSTANFESTYQYGGGYVWNELCSWDIKQTWCKMASVNVIVLQVFQNFSAYIATERNSDGIMMQIQQFSLETNKYENTTNTSFKYGTKLRLYVTISDELYTYKNIKNLKSVTEYSDNLEIQAGEKEATYDFVLNYSTAKLYYAITEDVKYKINVETENSNRGNVKVSSSSSVYPFLSQEIQYLGQYSFTASPVSSSFAFQKWVWVDKDGIEQDAFCGNPNNGNLSSQFITINFGDTNQVDNNFTYLRTFMDNGVIKTNTSMQTEDDVYVFTLRAKFTEDTRNLEIKTNSTIASCSIYVDGILIDKINDYTSLFDKEVTRGRSIEITAVMREGFTFTGWETGSGRALSNFIDTANGENEMSLTIHLTITEDFVLYLTFAREEAQTIDLSFLWYILAGVGGAGVITVIIIVIKKRGGGGGRSREATFY